MSHEHSEESVRAAEPRLAERQRAEVERAIRELREARKGRRSVGVREILRARDEGRK